MQRSCQLLGISRQAIYQREQRLFLREKTLEPIRQWVLDIRRFMPRIGTRKLYWLICPKLEASGIKLGRDGLFKYLKEQGLLVRPKKSYTKTTNSKHWMKKHPNLLNEVSIDRPEKVFVSDITYVESDEGVHYLSLVTDACSRKIMGHHLSQDMRAKNVVQALKKAVQSRVTEQQLIHHSDRGNQYCSAVYQSELEHNNIVPSMTDGYDCYQNAMAERVNGILKQEFLLHRCSSFDELKVLVDQSVEIYNTLRPHLSLGMQTPENVHKKASLA